MSPVSGRGDPRPRHGEVHVMGRSCGTLFERRWLGRRRYRVVSDVVDGKARVWELSARDQAEAELLHHALCEHLGGDRTEALRWRSGSLRRGAAAAHVDLVRFVYLNSDHGHRVGDWVLEGVARVLVRGLAPRRVFRTGGDEFLVELPEPIDAGSAEVLANEIRRLVSEPVAGLPPVEARVGITLLRNDGDEDAVLRSARDAEAHAARAGHPFVVTGR